MGANGGYVFISHSHYDIDVVRSIRNRFEQYGFEPLVFFLKCLNDNDEIAELIKREIDEREWFVFVDSDNSRRSDWVRSECAYISEQTGKKMFTIKTDEPVEPQVDVIVRQLSVYISYAVRDVSLAYRVRDGLLKRDFRVYITIDELEVGVDFATTAIKGIEQAAQSGFMLLLVTENMKDSYIVHREIAIAKKHGAKIIPVYVGDGELNAKQSKALGEHEPVYVEELSQENIELVIEQIEQRIGFRRSEELDLSVFTKK